MMLLTEKSPLKTPIVFGGLSFFIDMSFNNILSVFEILDDKELTEGERGLLALELLTDDEMFMDSDFLRDEDNLEFAQGLLGYVFDNLIVDKNVKASVPTDVLGNPLPVSKEDKKKSFDFRYDASFIYASFRFAYQMDLYKEHNQLHWHEFLALFNGLPSESIMMKVIEIRERKEATGKGSEKENKELRKMKRRFALPDDDLEEEDEND